MRERERVRIMERMREKVKERERRITERTKDKFHRERWREDDLSIKMAFVALNPLHLTIFRLLHSSRVSMDPRSREFLIFAAHGVDEALQLLTSLENFRDHVECTRMIALEGEIRKAAWKLEGMIREAAWKLENVLDSRVSDKFLSHSETGYERQPLLFSLTLEGIEQDIDGFIQMVMKMEKLLNPWLEEEEEEELEDNDGGGKESDIFGLSNQFEVEVIRTLFISWLPEEEEEEEEEEEGGGGGEEEEDGDGYAKESEEEKEDDDASICMCTLCMGFLIPCINKILVFLFNNKKEEDGDGGGGGGKASDIFGLSDRSEIDVTRTSFISWFSTKAASIFLGKKEEYIQDLENLLPQEEKDDDYAVLFTKDRTTDFSIMVSDKRFRKINGDLMIWWINKAAASIFVIEMGYTQRLVNPLPEDDDDDVAVVSSGTESCVNLVGSTDLFRKIRDDLLEDFEELKFGFI